MACLALGKEDCVIMDIIKEEKQGAAAYKYALK